MQFTPDLMPGDVTGSLVYDARTAEFAFRAGPVFTNLLLADEINRTPPKTQAALLEAMEERQVRVDGEPRPLPDPFIVAATQNPIEYEGTYPLPEAQLDRFLLKLDGAAAAAGRGGRRCCAGTPRGFDPRDLAAAGVRPVAGAADLAAGRAAVREVHGRRRGARLHRRHRAGPPGESPSLSARRLAARRDRAAGDGPGVGLAVRPRLRDARRRQGAGPADAAAPGRAAARGRAGGRRPPTACSTASSPPCRSRAERWR